MLISRPAIGEKRILLAGFVVMAWLILAMTATAEKLRVTTWSLQPSSAAGTNGFSAQYQQTLIQEAADVLKKLDPDVILLQQVRDAQSYTELANALKPAKYYASAFSSFRQPGTGLLSQQQVVILSKTKAYMAWSEPWKSQGRTAVTPGGYAFASIHAGERTIGFFSVQLSDESLTEEEAHNEIQQAARAESVRQLLLQVTPVRNTSASRSQTFVVVAGNFNTTRDDAAAAEEKTLPMIEEYGLTNVFGDLPLEKRITRAGNDSRPGATMDYIFTSDRGRVSSPEITSTALTDHYPVTCDVDLDASPILTKPATVARAIASSNKPATASQSASEASSISSEAAVTVPETSRGIMALKVILIAGGALGIVILLIRQLAARLEARPEPVARPAMQARTTAGVATSATAAPRRFVVSSQPIQMAGTAPGYSSAARNEGNSAQAQYWQQRAEEAERRAAQAVAAVKEGLMPDLQQWLKGELVQRLAADRAQLMESQEAAGLKMQAVDERLAKIEQQLQERNRVYEKRIGELERELSDALEENRELIRAKIALVRAEMERERAAAALQRSEMQFN